MPMKKMEQGMAEFKAGKGGPLVKNRMGSLGKDRQKRKMSLKRTIDKLDNFKA
jgi:hypothetical protein